MERVQFCILSINFLPHRIHHIMSHFTIRRRQPRKNLYRLGVGIVLFNREGKVLVGQRLDMQSDAWQMPQGGVDANETPLAAAWREMEEEIGTKEAELLGESSQWFSYNLPPDLQKVLWSGKYRGQRQKWFAFRFLGDDQDINIQTQHPEFRNWQWIEFQEAPNLIVPFKRDLYKQVVKEFEHFKQQLLKEPTV